MVPYIRSGRKLSLIYAGHSPSVDVLQIEYPGNHHVIRGGVDAPKFEGLHPKITPLTKKLFRSLLILFLQQEQWRQSAPLQQKEDLQFWYVTNC